MAEEFTGFANAPVDKKGKRLDFRDVEAFVDESDEGKARDESQTTPSSLAQFKTNDQATNGAPAAQVPAPTGVDKTGTDSTDAKAAEGKEASGS